jgi:HTH-type transcriptional regulator/antitoxin HigA
MRLKQSRSTTSLRTRSTTAAGGKKTATAKNRFNRRRYGALLAEAIPRVITSGAELERISRQAEPFLKKGEACTAEESALLDLLLKLIDDYQEKNSIIPKLEPHEALQYLMEVNSLRQADLVEVFGSRSRVSDAVTGKRDISKDQAKRLGEYFCVSPALFI